MRARQFLNERGLKATASPNIDSVKQNIKQQVDNIQDIDELHQVYSYIRKIDIGGGVDGVIKKDEDLRQVHNIVSRSIIDAKAPFEDKMAFATELASKGIINIKKLLTPGAVQSLESIITTKYPEIYKQVAPDLINIAGTFKSGNIATAKGKGEVFLALASPKIMLSKDAGDLVIAGKLVEVKGDGGRIKGVRGYGNTSQSIATVKKNAAALAAKVSGNVKAAPDAPAVKGQRQPKVAAGSPATAYTNSANIGKTSAFWTGLGPSLIESGLSPKEVVKFIKGSLKDILSSYFLDASDAELNSLINPSVSKEGTILFEAFIPLLKSFSYTYYQAHDDFEGILFLNHKTMNLSYVNSAEGFSGVKIQKLGLDPGAQNGMQVSLP